LVPVEEETTIIKLKGFIGKPEFGKKTRGEQYFFVNNRFIRDPYLNHAVMGAYSELLPTDTYPLYVLFIDIDPSKIDINVHPTKTEIKYQDDRSIYAIIRSAVKRSLGRYNITPSLDFDQENGFSQMVTPKPLDEIVPPSITFNPDFNPFDTETKKNSGFGGSSSQNPRERRSAMNQNWESLYEISQKESFTQLPIPTLEVVDDELKQIGGKAIFQLHNRYIVSQIRSGFMLIDQQAAHERVLFERFSQQLENQKGASQQSLFPQTINLNSADFELIQDLLADIQALGFLIRPFGKNAFVIDGIPADLASSLGASQVLEQLLENYKNNQQVSRLSKRENLAQSLARSTAIKAGTALSGEEMADLIDKLFACESPNISLSSKNVIITFTLKELLEKFGK
jgi:DNA mismatch repair protein MutL